jgi:hypothetical protein
VAAKSLEGEEKAIQIGETETKAITIGHENEETNVNEKGLL